MFDKLTPTLEGEVPHKDWIELHNEGGGSVDLSGWGLSDDPMQPFRWTFPTGAVLDPGGYLVIIADGTGQQGIYLHCNFSLSASGETLQLTNAEGSVQDLWLRFPQQDCFHSYGRRSGDGAFKYFALSTPGSANPVDGLSSLLSTPLFSLAPSFYDGPITVQSDAEAGTSIMYTTDGSDPTASNGTLYTGTLAFSEPVSLRARAVRSGHVSSEIRTATYLIYEPSGTDAVLRQLPAIALNGDDWRTFYNPNGITGEDSSDSPEGNYKIRLQRGRSTERQAHVEVLLPNNGFPVFNSGAGIRYAASSSTRNFTVFSNLETGPWPISSEGRPTFNLFLRDDYGKSSIEAPPLIPESTLAYHTSLRLRAGKTDLDLFTKDEIIRRALRDMGHPSAMGTMADLWVDGDYKGYFNLIERYRTDFFQAYYNDTIDWDIISAQGDIEGGDAIAWQTLRTFYASHNLSILDNYLAFAELMDLDNFIDYLLVNSYAANTDWTSNNFYFARPKIAGARFRVLSWDNEATFREERTPAATYDIYTSAQLTPSGTGSSNVIGELFMALKDSPEFKLRMADRMAEHLFHDGALTEARWVARQEALVTLIQPIYEHLRVETILQASFMIGLRHGMLE